MKTLILVLMTMHLFSCGEYKEAPIRIPIKPYVIIDKISDNTDYCIVFVDAKGERFNFDVNFTNEQNYNVGDTIK